MRRTLESVDWIHIQNFWLKDGRILSVCHLKKEKVIWTIEIKSTTNRYLWNVASGRATSDDLQISSWQFCWESSRTLYLRSSSITPATVPNSCPMVMFSLLGKLVAHKWKLRQSFEIDASLVTPNIQMMKLSALVWLCGVAEVSCWV
jgi:hypothetical protein